MTEMHCNLAAQGSFVIIIQGISPGFAIFINQSFIEQLCGAPVKSTYWVIGNPLCLIFLLSE